MRGIIFRVLAALFLLAVLSGQAWACRFDTDCSPGSVCLKPANSIYGVCAGGIFPGNKNDSQPVYSPTDTNRSYGSTCKFDTDCGPGSVCAKSGYNVYGVCMKGN